MNRLFVLLITCCCSLAWPACGFAAEPVYFSTDVIPVLTKYGCNSGGCHGKATGQNGFKISLLGFQPADDYQAVVSEGRGRRVFPSSPDQSLLLLKAVNAVPHGGGRRLQADSDDYQTLRRWIAAGATAPASTDPTLEAIQVFPERATLKVGDSQQLKVIARLSNGLQRDVSRQAVFESNAKEMATVDEFGLVKTTRKTGLFSVMVRFGGQIKTFHAVVPVEASVEQRALVNAKLSKLANSRRDPIDQLMIKQWRRLGISPSNPADDYQFVRRTSIDITGTLPTRNEVEEYVADKRLDKKIKLINRLLSRREHASYFTLKWADILQNRGSGYSTRKQREGTALFAGWIRDSLAKNKPYDEFVTDIITASGSQEENPPTVWYRHVRTGQNYVESVAQAFLGVRIQCAQCHHHPFDRWSQGDYYGLAAIFGRVGRKGGFADAEVPTNEVIFLKDSGDVHHPRTGVLVPPKPLGDAEFMVTKYDDPRQRFAKWMTSSTNPFFARTMVNRLWAHFMGRGVIHPIDDARSTNPPTNPELLNELSQRFVASGYDIKQLIRTICTTYAYGLEPVPNKTNASDNQTYARFYARRMTAEVLLDAYSQVLDVPTKFPGGPGEFPLGTRAIDLPDENVPASFLDVFGRPARSSACECERVDSPGLAQALTLINSNEIHRKLTDKNGYAAQLISNGKTVEENTVDIFLRLFSRPPTKREINVVIEFMNEEKDKAEAYRSVLWSLLATNEFMFNH